MSYMITLVVLEPTKEIEEKIKTVNSGNLIIEEVNQEKRNAVSYAGYLRGLWRRLGKEYHAFAIYLMADMGNGYISSSPFVVGSQYEYEIIRFGPDYRNNVDMLLQICLGCSEINEAVLLCEPTFYPDNFDLEDVYSDYDITGPLNVKRFWNLHDKKELKEQVIYLIKDKGRFRDCTEQ